MITLPAFAVFFKTRYAVAILPTPVSIMFI